MRPIPFILTLASFLALSLPFTAAISSVSPLVLTDTPLPRADQPLLAPRLEIPPADFLEKRGESRWIFGNFKTNDGMCKEAGKCELWATLMGNGHARPWCLTWEGGNGYTPLQQPSIEAAAIKQPNTTSDIPQWVCFFYNDFDCDPHKDGWEALTDLTYKEKHMKPTDYLALDWDAGAQRRTSYYKAYGCMLYDDAPYVDTDAKKEPPGSSGSSTSATLTKTPSKSAEKSAVPTKTHCEADNFDECLKSRRVDEAQSKTADAVVTTSHPSH